MAAPRFGLGLVLLLWDLEARADEVRLLLLARGVRRTGDGSREEKVEVAADAGADTGGEILGARDRLGTLFWLFWGGCSLVSPSGPLRPRAVPLGIAAVDLEAADDPLGDADGRSAVEAMMMVESEEKGVGHKTQSHRSNHAEACLLDNLQNCNPFPESSRQTNEQQPHAVGRLLVVLRMLWRAGRSEQKHANGSFPRQGPQRPDGQTATAGLV